MRIERRRSSATAVAYPTSYPSWPWHQAVAAVINRHDGTGSEFGTALCGTPQHVPSLLKATGPAEGPGVRIPLPPRQTLRARQPDG